MVSCLSCGPASVLWDPSKISWGGCGRDAEWNKAAKQQNMTFDTLYHIGLSPILHRCEMQRESLSPQTMQWLSPSAGRLAEDTLTQHCVIKMAHLRTFTAFRLRLSLPCPRNQEPLPACPVPLFCFINNSIFSLQKQYF